MHYILHYLFYLQTEASRCHHLKQCYCPTYEELLCPGPGVITLLSLKTALVPERIHFIDIREKTLWPNILHDFNSTFTALEILNVENCSCTSYLLNELKLHFDFVILHSCHSYTTMTSTSTTTTSIITTMTPTTTNATTTVTNMTTAIPTHNFTSIHNMTTDFSTLTESITPMHDKPSDDTQYNRQLAMTGLIISACLLGIFVLYCIYHFISLLLHIFCHVSYKNTAHTKLVQK